MNSHIDQYGMVCSRHTHGTDELGRPITPENPWLDGGDSANRTMAYYIGKKLLNENISDSVVRDVLNHLECPNSRGNYRRHPDSLFWYSDCDRMSRDQSIPVVVGMGIFNQKKHLRDFFLRHLFRGLLFTTNTRRNGTTKENHGQSYGNGKVRNYNWKLPDFTGPEFWSLYIRAAKLKILYPLLLIFDFFLLISSIVTKKQKDKKDVINHTISCVNAGHTMPTPFSYIANKYVNDPKDLAKRMYEFYDHPKILQDIPMIWEKVCHKYFG